MENMIAVLNNDRTEKNIKDPVMINTKTDLQIKEVFTRVNFKQLSKMDRAFEFPNPYLPSKKIWKFDHRFCKTCKGGKVFSDWKFEKKFIHDPDFTDLGCSVCQTVYRFKNKERTILKTGTSIDVLIDLL
jgi:hypothetical protein